MKKLQFLIVVLMVSVLVAVAGCSSKGYEAQPAPQNPPQSAQPPAPPAPPAASSSGTSIEISSSGFSPQTITVKQGDTVTFLNNDATAHWPASAMHPTHTLYPGSDIAKCGSSEEGSIFDACKGLQQGETFKFIFNENGSWRYHDHLNPSLWGTIVVE